MFPSAFRAPVDDGATLVVPDEDAIPALVEQNRALRASWQVDILGRSLDALAGEARRSLIAAAVGYSSQYRDVPQLSGDDVVQRPLLMGGHQPELFHPGVWLKNFLLDELACRVGGVALNLVVDGDVLKSGTLPVPTGSVDEPEVVRLPFDDASAGTPYEQRRIHNPARFADFGPRACRLLKPLVSHPWLEEFWPEVIERGQATGLVGMAFAQARHRLEGTLGLTTLEMPQSVMCSQPVFHRFTAHALGNLEMLRDLYNRAIRDYRDVHHLRSANHPATELARLGNLVESPFWLWTVDDPRRRRLFVERRGREFWLSDRQQWRTLMPDPLADADGAIAALARLESQGIKLRTAALLTTLFTRVFLADLFLHGIGGGKYDAVTDEIIRGFYGVEPPRYAIATGTRRLPIERPRVAAADRSDNARRQWSLLHHPESFLTGKLPADVQALVDEKRSLVAESPTTATARRRCQAIRAVNVALRSNLSRQQQQLHDQRQRLDQLWRNEQILGWREYPWPWHPRTTLQDFLLAFRRSRP